jgi:hypothetical protein
VRILIHLSVGGKSSAEPKEPPEHKEKEIQPLKDRLEQPEAPKIKPSSEPKPSEEKVVPAPEHPAPKKELSTKPPLPAEPAPTSGNRGERRVRLSFATMKSKLIVLGQNEPHAFTDCGEIEGIAEHCGIFDYFQ